MPIAIIQGSGDVGSAVAHQLSLGGFQVIIVDVIAPAHSRRGMSFVDAYYKDIAELEGIRAYYVESINFKDAHDLLVSTQDVEQVLRQLDVAVVIDARMRKRMLPDLPDWKSHYKALLVGLGPGFAPGINCDIAIETAWGEYLGSEVKEFTMPLGGEPKPIDGFTRERIVYAPKAGAWDTLLNIGDVVSAGGAIGQIDGEVIQAPMTGKLKGISHAKAQVNKNQKIVEIDPSHQEQIYGLGERPKKIAQGVLNALKTRL